MITKINVFLVVMALTSGFGREEYARTFDKTLTLRPGEKLYLEHRLGDITIRAHAQPEIVIHAEIKVSASDLDQAKRFADRIEILLEPSSSQLSIRTRYPERQDSFLGLHNVSYYVRYDIAIPETTPLEVRNSFGGVSVAGLKADSEITTSHGALEFRDGHGAQRLENSFSGVKVANNTGDVAVETNNGPVDVSGVNGTLSVRDRFSNVTVSGASKGLTILNSNGTVQVTDSGGAGNIRNSFGNVTVRGFKGDLTVNNANGKVEAVLVEGSAELNTTFGEVQFQDIRRQLSIRANNCRIHGERVGGPLAIQNSFGPVTVSGVQGSVRIQSGNGGVSLAKIQGEASVRTSFAMVEAADIGGALFVENSNGGVKANNTHGAQVTTSFAPVLLEGVTGPMNVEDQNGLVDAASSTRGVCEPIIIRTSFSPLRVRLQGDPSYRVAARTSFGKIRTDYPLNVSGSISNDGVNGVIGAGRCEMRLTNNNGPIEILKAGS